MAFIRCGGGNESSGVNVSHYSYNYAMAQGVNNIIAIPCASGKKYKISLFDEYKSNGYDYGYLTSTEPYIDNSIGDVESIIPKTNAGSYRDDGEYNRQTYYYEWIVVPTQDGNINLYTGVKYNRVISQADNKNGFYHNCRVVVSEIMG